MELSALLEGLDVVEWRGDPAVAVVSVTHDSRQVRPGALFCCVSGLTADGHDHAAAAVEAGAVALLVERVLDLPVAQVVVPSVRPAMGRVAANLHGHPSRSLDVIGVTGTNGKTTTTWLLRSILDAVGRPTALLGTLSGARTTPEATDLQAALAQFRDEGFAAVSMEVSSHALALDRVAGTRFRLAVFTNLGRDHLDFHPTEEDYFAAKARLFEPDLAEAAVVNADDPHGPLLADAAAIPTTTFSLNEVRDLVVGARASRGVWRGQPLLVPIGGRFNVANALAALTAAVELGVEPADAVAGLAGAPPVPGRFESIDAGQPFDVVVDFAHTPDGLTVALAAARAATQGRLLVVFGCGGDRDREKRPLMGAAAAAGADVVVLTSDNPRSEDPAAIISAVMAGTVGGRADVRVEPDRRAAIARALAEARPDDLVLIAGKGHETTQTIGDVASPFDDRDVVRQLLAEADPRTTP